MCHLCAGVTQTLQKGTILSFLRSSSHKVCQSTEVRIENVLVRVDRLSRYLFCTAS